MAAGPGQNVIIDRAIGISIDSPGAWITSNRTVDPSGQVVETFPSWVSDCAPPPGRTSTEQPGVLHPARGRGLPAAGRVPPRVAVLAAPAGARPGLLLLLAGLLSGFCFWRIRRDLT